MVDQETLRRLAHLDTGGLPIVSLYVPVPTDPTARAALPTRVNSLLSRIRPLASSEELERDERLSLRADIEDIENDLKDRWTPGGRAVFSCHGAGIFESIDLPRGPRDRIVVDTTPWLRPLFSIVEDLKTYGVVVLDGSEAEFFEMRGGELTSSSVLRSEHLRQSAHGGWYGLEEHRMQNKAEEMLNRHYRAVAGAVEQMVRIDGIGLLVFGGLDQHPTAMAQMLPRDIQDLVVGTFSVDMANATPARIAEQVSEIVAAYELEDEQRTVQEFCDEAGGSDRAVVGVEEVLWAADVDAVDRLFIDHDATLGGVMCPECGWLGTGGDTCPMCGTEPQEVPDVLDELVAAVLDSGGRILQVRAETPLREKLVAARLRFPPPPRP